VSGVLIEVNNACKAPSWLSRIDGVAFMRLSQMPARAFGERRTHLREYRRLVFPRCDLPPAARVLIDPVKMKSQASGRIVRGKERRLAVLMKNV